MAVIDPRLFPLIETLVISGADWLAFEILDGIRVGRVREDSGEELNKARLAVRSFRSKIGYSEEAEAGPSAGTPTAAKPIAGDEQIDWAATYVADRLSASLLMLEASLAQLESIVSRSPRLDAIAHDVSTQSDSEVSLRLEGEEITVRRIQVTEAVAGLSSLREALSKWSESVRLGDHS